MLLERLNDAAETWLDWLAAGLLESTILLIVVGLLLLAVRRRLPAAVAHVLLLVVLVKSVLPFGLPIPRPELSLAELVPVEMPEVVSEPEPSESPEEPAATRPSKQDSGVSSQSTALSPLTTNAGEIHEPTDVGGRPNVMAPTQPIRLSWQAWGMLVWLAGAVGIGLQLIVSQYRLRRALSIASPGDDDIGELVQTLAVQSGIRRTMAVVTGPEGLSPGISGWSRPTLIVPRGLADRLSDEQLRWVLAHELAHLRRGDLMWLMVVRMSQCIAWFNPAVWIAAHWAEHYRECACDELALRHVSCGRAECGEAFLALLAGASSGPRLAMQFLSRGRFAQYRMLRLLDVRPQTFAQQLFATVVSIGCVFAFGGVSFYTRPASAAAQPVRAASSVEPAKAEATPPSGDAETEVHLRRIWEQQNAPMKTGRVRVKLLNLASFPKDPAQQGHDLADRSKAEVEALLDDLDLTDASCFRQIRDSLLAGNLILDQPAYRTLDLIWNENGRRASWGNGVTTIVTESCAFEHDPAARSASITSGGYFHLPRADWAKLILAVPLRSTILSDFQGDRAPFSIKHSPDGTTQVEFKRAPDAIRRESLTMQLGADGALLRVIDREGMNSMLREIDFREYQGGVLLPRTRVRTYSPLVRNGEELTSGPLQSLSISIIEHAEFNIEIPDSEFRLAVPANTAVWDRRGELKLRAAETATDDVLTLFER